MRNTAITHKPRDKRCAHLSSKVLKGLEEKTLPRDSHPNLPRAFQQTHTMRALGFGLQTWRLCTVAFHTHLLELCGWRSPFSTRNRERMLWHWFYFVLISSAWWQLTQGRDREAGTKHLHDENAHIQKYTDTQSYHTVGFLIIDASEFNWHQN